jgi:hypothetical protein
MAFLPPAADRRGTRFRVGEESQERLHGVIGDAVDNGVLFNDATRQVRTVTSTAAKSKERDHTRATTRSERDHVQATLVAAREPGLNPRTRRKRRARQQISSHSWQGQGPGSTKRGAFGGRTSNLELGRVYLRGTKSETSVTNPARS